jgi:hypothetical protein
MQTLLDQAGGRKPDESMVGNKADQTRFQAQAVEARLETVQIVPNSVK